MNFDPLEWKGFLQSNKYRCHITAKIAVLQASHWNTAGTDLGTIHTLQSQSAQYGG